MKSIENDPLNLKLKPANAILGIIASLPASLALLAVMGLSAAGIGLSHGFADNYLESALFMSVHRNEHLTVYVYDAMQRFFDSRFTFMLLLSLLALVLLLLVMYFAVSKNSYAFFKYLSGSFISCGIVLIVFPIVFMIAGIDSSPKLATPQNTLLFSSYMKSTFFIFIAFGVLALALAYVCQFAASAISRKRGLEFAKRKHHEETFIRHT